MPNPSTVSIRLMRWRCPGKGVNAGSVRIFGESWSRLQPRRDSRRAAPGFGGAKLAASGDGGLAQAPAAQSSSGFIFSPVRFSSAALCLTAFGAKDSAVLSSCNGIPR